MTFEQRFHRPGFSLIELLLVIAIMALLMFVTLLALNPTKQLADARNAQRQSDVNVLINATHQYLVDHDALPGQIPLSTSKEICRTGNAGLPCTNGVRLEELSGTYIAEVPHDPLAPTTGTGTRYWIVRDPADRVTVIAPYAERNKNIYMTR